MVRPINPNVNDDLQTFHRKLAVLILVSNRQIKFTMKQNPSATTKTIIKELIINKHYYFCDEHLNLIHNIIIRRIEKSYNYQKDQRQVYIYFMTFSK